VGLLLLVLALVVVHKELLSAVVGRQRMRSNPMDLEKILGSVLVKVWAKEDRREGWEVFNNPHLVQDSMVQVLAGLEQMLVRGQVLDPRFNSHNSISKDRDLS